MFRSGYVQIASFRGVPIRLHATVPLLCVLWGGLRFAPGMWLGALFAVLLHELGHAALARRYRMRVTEVMLHGLGGHCAYIGDPTPWQRAIIASGGVLAQGLLFLVALPAQLALDLHVGSGGSAPPMFVRDLLSAWTYANAAILVFNLMPLGPLDGVEIWKLPGLWLARRRRGAGKTSSRTSPKTPPTTHGSPRPATKASSAAEPTPHVSAVDEEAVRETVRRALEQARRGGDPS